MHKAQELTVVMYHYVRPILESAYPEIKGLEVDGFRRQLDYLEQRYNYVTMEEVVGAISRGLELPESPVLLTFDDGYVDHYQYVFPELSKRGVQGSFFVLTDVIYEKGFLDVNRIHYLLACVEDKRDLVEEIYSQLNLVREEYELDGNAALFRRYSDVGYHKDLPEVRFTKQILQRALPLKVRVKLIDKLFSKYVTDDAESFHSKLYLGMEQLKEMKNGGMHIGSHAKSHQWLSTLTEEEQRDELVSSIELLKAVGEDPNTSSICYPYGDYNETTLRLANELNYQVGFSTQVAPAILNRMNALMLPRYDTNDFPQ